MSDEFNPLYRTSLTGWKAGAFVVFATWCLASGMYTLALVVRAALG